MEERGWSIFNGNCKGDEVGEYTFTGGRGCTVIDYVMGDSEVRERIAEMKIGDKIDSDHQPIEVMIKGTGMKRRGERGLEKCWRGVWNEKGRREFKECIDTIEMREREIREDWREMEERFKEAMETAERKIVRSRKKGDEWWDEECKKKKREVRRELRLWRKERGDEERYRERKREYKQLIEEKKKELSDKWEKKAVEVRGEKEVWEIINKDRNKRKRVNDGKVMEEWKEHFMRLLGEVEGRVVRGMEGRGGDEEEEISRKEVTEVLQKLKEGKAVGEDGIPNEAWKYGGRK
ncbi:golgin subfamily A member 6-like protein 22 [Ooceraea biroi]|uniref:golgin subfamily A member 6-like protein 22 n=1 Tax=Ooceraea biroi TaxID=2015173 RepID=UPI000F07C481|nr:golgin subfamily A member 6-like protein 22 [Ooceraea biroi]